jgi:uncharacterized protein (TIRG00374 family)
MKRLVGLLISAVLLAALWWTVDLRNMAAAVAAADPIWLGSGLAAVVPLTVATAWRFVLLSERQLSIGSATRLILSASTLNLVLPSKMGDIAKSVVLTKRYGYDGKLALALVTIEKIIDLASLLFWGVLALFWVAGGDPLLLLAAAALAGLLAVLLILISPTDAAPRLIEALARFVPGKAGQAAASFGEEWRSVTRWFWSRGRPLSIALLSLAIWAGHLAQFWLFAQALAPVPFLDNMAMATLAILVGLLPFTFAGIGTRDAAIVFFYRAWLTAGEAAVLGVLATLRYVIPALAGLAFMSDYVGEKAERPR